VREPDRVRRLFAERLATLGDACDPGFGFDMVRLAALVTERQDPTQTGLTAPDHGVELAHLIDRFGARFGLRRIVRLVPHDSHIPEFAVAAVPAHAVKASSYANSSEALRRSAPQRPLPRLRGRDRERACVKIRASLPSPHPSPASGGGSRPSLPHRQWPSAEADRDSIQDTLAPTRPIRLFERPEPIEAMAEVPDGPPAQFTWRRVHHMVAHAEGPERIAMEWWRDEQGHALTRDYFRVESREGVRVWIYREGLYGRETERPQWFLHGLFA
jgi:protein ImuB